MGDDCSAQTRQSAAMEGAERPLCSYMQPVYLVMVDNGIQQLRMSLQEYCLAALNTTVQTRTS